MHVLLVTIGSAGDVHPFVGIGLRLKERGHRVTLMTSGYFEKLVRAAGLEFAQLGTKEEFEAAAADPRLWHPTFGIRRILETLTPNIPKLYEKIAAMYVPGEMVMGASSLAIGARIAEDKLGIPTATIHLSPAVPRTVHDTPTMAGFPSGPSWPAWIKRLAYWSADTIVIDPLIRPAVNRYRAELGLAPVKHIFDQWWHSPRRIIGMWPAWFGEVQPDWPGQLRLAGFPLYDERGVSSMSEELRSFLDGGDAPIVFTPGSAMFHGDDFFRESTKACEMIGRRGLLLSRHRDHIPKNLPPSVKYFDYAPFSEILPRAAALVHHAGVGTTAQALASGCPQLPMPLAFDQFDNAARVEKLGVARSVPKKRYRASRVAEALKSLIEDARVKRNAMEVAKRFEGADGIGKACELIEELQAAARPAREMAPVGAG